MVHFWPTFPILEAKKCLENPALSLTTSYRFLASCQNLVKTDDTIPRKRPDKRRDGQTLFHRTLPANAGGPIKTADFLRKVFEFQFTLD